MKCATRKWRRTLVKRRQKPLEKGGRTEDCFLLRVRHRLLKGLSGRELITDILVI